MNPNFPPITVVRIQPNAACLISTGSLTLLLLWLTAAKTAAAGIGLGAPPEPFADYRNNYFVIQDRDSQLVVRRGLTGNGGRIFNAETILAPNKRYRVWIFNPRERLLGWSDVDTPDPGERLQMVDVRLGTDIGKDLDGDGLSNEAEFVIGTDPQNPDTDGNGRNDSEDAFQRANAQHERITAEELRRRRDPGFVATSPTPAPAVDICAANDVAVVSFGADGVGIYNIFSGLNPTLIAQVDTPGDAQAVACGGSRVVVADGLAGLQILDVSRPADVRILRSVKLPALTAAVAVAGGIAYAFSFRYLSAVDIESGVVIEQVFIGGLTLPIYDMVVDRGILYLLGEELRAYDISQGVIEFKGSIPTPVPAEGLTRGKRLAVGDGLAYATGYNGFEVIDVRQPSAMVRVGTVVDRGPNSFKQILPNGSGIGVAAAGINPRPDGTHDIYLYDISQASDTTRFQAALRTPGTAYAVALYNGLAYVADGEAGIQVVSYRPLDFARRAPTIELEASFSLSPPAAEEGKRAWIYAKTRDDVEVRNVEFYLDGVKVATDGSFPFQYDFVTPSISAAKQSFQIRVRASDQGGNTTWTDEVTVTLTPDRQPPRVRRTIPSIGSVAGRVRGVSLIFSEPIDRSTITRESVRLSTAGPDRVFGTQDDRVISSGELSYQEETQMVQLTLPDDLLAGRYQLQVGSQLSDRPGNRIVPGVVGSFWVLDREDADGDGLPTSEEFALGVHPGSVDSDLDGLSDGEEDFDSDGLPNAIELALGRDPTKSNSVDPQIKDGDLDLDFDGLSDALEVRFGTDPFLADSDGDGWNDEQEMSAGSSPISSNSTPALFTYNRNAPVVLPLGLASDPRSPFPPTLGAPVSRPLVKVTIQPKP